MTERTTKLPEAELRELAARGAAELEGASASDVLRWTDETFGGVNGPRGWATCNYVVASSMQEAVLIDLAAKVRPGVPVVFLDTGYHFAETIGTRDAIESVYDIRVLNVTPEHSVAEQDKLLGKDLFARDPGECCRLRKVAPLGKTLRGYSAWVTGLRRSEAATRANAPVIGFDEGFKLVKVNPMATWTDEDVQNYIDEHNVLVNPLIYEGYSSIGCAPARPSRWPAPTRAAGAGRAWPRRNAGCTPRKAFGANLFGCRAEERSLRRRQGGLVGAVAGDRGHRRRAGSDRRNPGGPHVDGVALAQGQRLGVTAGDLRREGPAGGRAGQLDPHLETQLDHPVDDGPGHTRRLGGAVLGRHRHLGSAAHPDVVRSHQSAVERGHRTQKRHHERVRRGVVHLGRGSDLLDAALVEHRDPIGDIQRLGLVVGDQHRGHVHLVVQPAQPGAQVLAHLGVQRAERLVEQQHLRVDGQRPRQRHPLPLPTGQLVGVAALKTAQPHHFQQIVHLGLDLGLGRLRTLRP